MVTDTEQIERQLPNVIKTFFDRKCLQALLIAFKMLHNFISSIDWVKRWWVCLCSKGWTGVQTARQLEKGGRGVVVVVVVGGGGIIAFEFKVGTDANLCLLKAVSINRILSMNRETSMA